MTRIWSTLTARIANADLLPLDEPRYAGRIGDFLAEVRHRWTLTAPRGASADLAVAVSALARFEEAAIAAAARSSAALERGDRPALDAINRGLMRVEPALLDPSGLEGRPWYRHQVYAPAFTYEPQVLPGLSEAVDTGDAARVAEQERRLAAALNRAAEALTLP